MTPWCHQIYSQHRQTNGLFSRDFLLEQAQLARPARLPHLSCSVVCASATRRHMDF